MIYFFSDTHFNHSHIIEYCNRPFNNVNKMNNTLIINWNSVVKKDDMVYHLEDLILIEDEELKKYIYTFIYKRINFFDFTLFL